MKANVVDIKGKVIKEIELNDSVFNVKLNKTVIYEAIKNELANKRQGTSSTKTKAEVAGTGAKPWRQKGTGRARVGTRRNPVWRGGGVAFGPKPRDYSYRLPKKVKNLAYRSLLSWKFNKGDVIIVDDIKLKSGKTKELNEIMKNIAEKTWVNLILTDDENDNLTKRAGKNIPWVGCLSFKRLNIHDLYYGKKTVITEKAVICLEKMLNKTKEEVK